MCIHVSKCIHKYICTSVCAKTHSFCFNCSLTLSLSQLSRSSTLSYFVLLMFLCFALFFCCFFFGTASVAAKCIEFCEFCFAANKRIQGQMTSAKHFSCCSLLLLVSGARHVLSGALYTILFSCYLRLCFLLQVCFVFYFLIFS